VLGGNSQVLMDAYKSLKLLVHYLVSRSYQYSYTNYIEIGKHANTCDNY